MRSLLAPRRTFNAFSRNGASLALGGALLGRWNVAARVKALSPPLPRALPLVARRCVVGAAHCCQYRGFDFKERYRTSDSDKFEGNIKYQIRGSVATNSYLFPDLQWVASLRAPGLAPARRVPRRRSRPRRWRERPSAHCWRAAWRCASSPVAAPPHHGRGVTAHALQI